MIIGLTGGIATGKSESAKYFEMLGAYVVDADAISCDITAKGMPALNELVKNLGDNILFSNGTLNRKKLAGIIFSDKKIKLIVEKILHARIISRVNKTIKLKKNEYDNIVINAPLLFEAGLNKICDKTVVVWAPYDIQARRLVLRDKLGVEQIKKRIYSQMPIGEKIELTDFTIDNTGSKKDLKKNIKALYILLTSKSK
ncbi:MAG: dephospho-CoA kinase [Endomicrobium sp.]|jgi:dephospho-CoA kinase|nr:dephospho-CoA kinase [Endomicrobium sp.]